MKNKLIYCGLAVGIISHAYAQEQETKPNVLFIAIDDLRPELNCYGYDYMHTPNIDRLAAKGTLFQQAYCQQAISAASRNSILTGYRPDGIGIYDLGTFFRTNVPDVVTLPQHFKNNGYRTEAVGKIYHVGHGNQDDHLSWTVPKWNPDKELGSLKRISNGDTTRLESMPRINNELIPYFATKIPEENMQDARVTTVALERMKAIKDEPFFLAVGFVKPHLPFVAPKKYWDLYDENDIVIPERKEPEDMPKQSMGPFEELRKYHGMPKTGFVNDQDTKGLIHGYRACVSFVDEQVGRLLDALEENELAENTIIVLWGDHGWKLGEYGNWCKHSNMELDVNSPLIISAPGFKGNVTNSLAEFVDVYPTLCDLSNLDKPDHLQGQSLVQVMADPQYAVKEVAFSQYPRGAKGDNLYNKYMGYSMRTGDYRYTRWVKFNSPEKEIVERELYNHSQGKLADKNLANNIEFKEKVRELDELMDNELAKYKVHPKVINPEETNSELHTIIKNDFLLDYTIGDSLEKGSYTTTVESAETFKEAWMIKSGSDGVDSKVIAPLVYDDYVESGKSFAFKVEKLSSGSRTFGYSLINSAKYNSGTFYLAFMINVGSDLSINSTDRTRNIIGFNTKFTLDLSRIVLSATKAGNTTGKFKFGIGQQHSASKGTYPMAWSSDLYNLSETYLAVLKYDFTTQIASLFIDPEINETEPLPLIEITLPNDAADGIEKRGLRAICLEQDQYKSCKVGGIRFANSWQDAIGEGEDKTGIFLFSEEKQGRIVSENYFALNGMQISNLFASDGDLYIKKTIYDNGSIKAEKIYK